MGLKMLRFCALVVVAVFFAFGTSMAGTVGSYKATTVAENWLNSYVKSYGSWAGSKSPAIVDLETIEYNNEVVGYNFVVSPSGHVLVPGMDELPIVKLYSETSSLGAESSDTDQVREWIAEELYKIGQAIEEHRGELETVDLSQTDNGKLWTLFSAPAAEFTQEYAADYEDGAEFLSVGPLLTTTWKQGDPYNLQCPLYSTGCRTIVGCVATAAAQIMRYWQHPANGTGSTSYTWYNGAANVTLSRNFASSTYDWGNMPNAISSSSSTTQKNAVAKLCGDVGVAFHMGYGCGASGANTMYGTTVYPTYFGYKSTIDDVYRTDYASDSAWMKVFKTESQAGRPSQFRMRDDSAGGHSVVVDGYRDSPSEQIHINMGWGGSYDGWYVSNNINTGSYHWTNVNYQGAVIGIQPAGGGTPSARVTSLWPVTGATCGGTARLWAQVNNNGSVTLPSGAQVYDWVTGPSWTGSNYVGYASVSGLTPGATSWYYKDWAIPSTRAAGTHTYYARVWNSSNGTWLSAWSSGKNFTVTCGGTPSARVTSLWSVTGATCGGTARLWAQVNNNGSVTLPSGAQVYDWVTGPSWTGSNYVGYASVSGLTPGATRWYHKDWAIPSTRAAGTHTYYARVWNSSNGTWLSNWSSGKNFTVTCGGGGFNSQFKGSADGWVTHSGSWYVNSEYLYTPGLSSNGSSVSYNATFSNFDYQVRLWRSPGCDGCANRIMVRGVPTPLYSTNKWNTGYIFQYTRSGSYSIYKHVNGSTTALKFWTSSSAINQGNAWNTLRVVANGTTIYFYINGTYMGAITNTSLTSGRVGIGVYSTGTYWVDWAKLATLGSASGVPEASSVDHFVIDDSLERQPLSEEEMDAADANFKGVSETETESFNGAEGIKGDPPSFDEMFGDGPPDPAKFQDWEPPSMNQGESIGLPEAVR